MILAYDGVIGDGYGAGAASVDITSDNDAAYADGVASVTLLQIMILFMPQVLHQ